jgi:hypothetical protein
MLGLLNAKSPRLLCGMKVIPFVIAPSHMFSRPLTPNSVADANAITSSEITNEDEAAIRMILQVTFKPYSFIFIECFNEI